MIFLYLNRNGNKISSFKEPFYNVDFDKNVTGIENSVDG